MACSALCTVGMVRMAETAGRAWTAGTAWMAGKARMVGTAEMAGTALTVGTDLITVPQYGQFGHLIGSTPEIG